MFRKKRGMCSVDWSIKQGRRATIGAREVTHKKDSQDGVIKVSSPGASALFEASGGEGMVDRFVLARNLAVVWRCLNNATRLASAQVPWKTTN